MDFGHRFQWEYSAAWTILAAVDGLTRNETPCVETPVFTQVAAQLASDSSVPTGKNPVVQGLGHTDELLRLVAEDQSGGNRASLSQWAEVKASEVEQELKRRSALLRQQWEARGPGMWRWLDSVLPSALRPQSQQIAPTLPYWGGHAEAVPGGYGAMIESVTFDPIPHLPEVTRLVHALLSSQFAVRHPKVSASRRHEVAVTLALAAGNYVELTRSSEDSIAEAIRIWGPKFGGYSLDEGGNPHLEFSTQDFEDSQLMAEWCRGQLD